MRGNALAGLRAGALFLLLSLMPASAPAEQVAVRYVEGVVHGFLVLRAPDGAILATGDLIQVGHGNTVNTQIVFRFKDGSTHDETAIFTQRGYFQLVSYHLVQKGPAFDQPLEMTIDRQSGQVTVRYKDDHGEEKIEAEHLELPPDLANGMISTLLKNVRPGAPPAKISYVAATPKPRLVSLAITKAAADPFSIAGSKRSATHYVLKVEIGGVSGLLAPILGKQPPDSHVWILQGEAPAFVKSEAPMFLGGPSWRIELTSPIWPSSSR